MEAQRQAETTRRLALLIDMLHEEAGEGAPAPPEHAAAAWSEAAVRAFFVHGEAPAEAAAVQPGQPGGGRVQAPPGGGAKPEAATRAQNVLEAETYRAVVLAAGIAERPHGLFPPGDGVLRAIVTDATLRPFEKHLVGASCALERAEVSWPVGDDAARRGIDLRYFYKTGAPSGVGAKLVAAVRFGDAAAIGAGFWTSTHGGAVETAFDEATAELAKCDLAPLATTITFSVELKKPVPLHTSLRVECAIESVASGGLRINTVGTLKDEQGTVLATCKAQLVDMGRLARATGA